MKHKSKHHWFGLWFLLPIVGWSGLKSSADSYGLPTDFELLQKRVVFSPSKNLIAVTGEDGVELWDARSKEKKRTIMQSSVVGNRAVNALAFSPDNRLIACGRPNATALLWDVATGRWTQPLGRYDGLVTALDFSPNGRVLAGGSYTSIDVTPESEKPKVGEYRRFPPSFYRRYKNTSEVTLRDAQTNALKWTAQWNDAELESLTFSHDGKSLAALASGKVRIYNTKSGQLQRELGTSFSNLCNIAFSPDGKLLVGSDYGACILIYEVRNGKLKHTLPTHDRLIYSVAFSPNGKLVCSAGCENMIRLYDVKTGVLKQTIVGLDLKLKEDESAGLKGYGDTSLRIATFSQSGKEVIAVGFGYNHFGSAPVNMAIQRWNIKKQ